jgi:hypothetical protein
VGAGRTLQPPVSVFVTWAASILEPEVPTGGNAKIDWKALSKRIDHADVAFTMKQYVQTDLEADREVANTLAELIIGGLLVTEVDDQGDEFDGESA